MENRAFFLVKTDSQAFVLKLNDSDGIWKMFEFVQWLNKKEPIAEGDAVVKWFEQNGAQLEGGFPMDEESHTINASEAELLEYTELLDELDIRL